VPEYELAGRRPRVHPEAWIAPTAVLIGDVEVGSGASVWFGAVLRGDQNLIRIAAGTNVQDNAVVHCSADLATLIGQNVTIGHSALLEGCEVGDEALVGMGSIMLQRSRLGRRSLLAAGAVLVEGAEIADGHIGAGVPARDRGEVSSRATRWVSSPAAHYQERARLFRDALRELEGAEVPRAG
jgi:carbonic anhydrase/acetyltransferase-like protein (isoleucine patch superfamily)